MNLLQQYERFEQIRHERKEIFDILDGADRLWQAGPSGMSGRSFQRSMGRDVPSDTYTLRVVMVLRVVYPNRGGVTSALRILRDLETRGCEVTVAVTSRELSVEENLKNARRCIPGFRGQVKSLSVCEHELYDVCIATGWRTVYAAALLSGYKIYFVQDYEPCFQGRNDFSELALESYRMGFHLISLGTWNLEQIRKNLPQHQDIRMDAVDFPYDRAEYPASGRRYESYQGKKKLRLACYLKFTGRRIPYICEYLLLHTKKDLALDGIELEVDYFGIDRRNRLEGGRNLGKLSRKALNRLYEKSDFGMVASMSNISLVPYEMLATGLPLIEFKTGSYPWFLGEDTALLVDFNWRTLADGIRSLLKDPQKLEDMHRKAEAKLENVSWQHTCEQFWNIMKGALQ